MASHTICPHCKKNYQNVPQDAYGKKTKCKYCDKVFLIKPVTSKQKPVRPINWVAGDCLLDKYEVIKEIGDGSFGKVYRVLHNDWSIELAVKSLKTEAINVLDDIVDFEKEAKIWINLGLHPNIVCCHFIRKIDNIPHIFIEFVDGHDLSHLIKQKRLYKGGKNVAIERVLSIAIQSAWGLDYAHEQGLIHQDVKPANFMVTTCGIVKITDFGLTKTRIFCNGQVDETIMSVISTGTPAYCSPEQLACQNLTKSSDIWSWAVSVLHMFVGKIIWGSGANVKPVLESMLNDQSKYNQILNIPVDIAELLLACLQLNPHHRPRSLMRIARILTDIYKRMIGVDFPYPEPAQTRIETADSLNNRALSLIDMDVPFQAKTTLEQAISVQPNHSQATFNLGLIRFRCHDIDKQCFLTEMAKTKENFQRDNEMWMYYYLVGLVHLETGDHEVANQWFSKISDFHHTRQIHRIINQMPANDSVNKQIAYSQSQGRQVLVPFQYCRVFTSKLLFASIQAPEHVSINVPKYQQITNQMQHPSCSITANSSNEPVLQPIKVLFSVFRQPLLFFICIMCAFYYLFENKTILNDIDKRLPANAASSGSNEHTTQSNRLR